MFYGIGDALAGEGGLDMGIIFLQFALYLEPDFPLAYAALAEAYDGAKKYELEMQALDQIKPRLAALAECADPEVVRAQLAGADRRCQGAARRAGQDR